MGSNKNKKWGKATIAGLVAAATLASPVVGAFAADGGGGSGDGTGTGDGSAGGTGKITWVYKDSFGSPTRENVKSAMGSVGVKSMDGSESNSAIDEAVSFIDRRIRKNKTRLAKNLRPDALVSTVPAEFDVVEDNDFDIIRTKRFSVKPMTTDEAVLQMNLLGHSFYVFRNIETNAVCVVYHRNNGGYGLIETEE